MICEAVNRIRSSLQIIVDLDEAKEEIEYRCNLAHKISNHSKLFLEVKISLADFLDLAESTEIDQYSAEIEENLE
jgi:hypothetical protein